MWTCQRCGYENPDNANFCGNCGGRKGEKPFPKQAVMIAAAAVIVIGLAAWIIPSMQSKASDETATVFPAQTTASPVQTEVPTPNVIEHIHTWGEWTVEVQPTCESAGLEVRVCQEDVNHKEEREITELGHDWVPATFTQPQYCARCGISSGRPSPESTFPTVEEVKYLFDHNTHTTVSNTGANLTLPKDGNFLNNPYRTKIKASRIGGRIYIMPIPKSGNGNLGTIADGTEVVIVAKQNDCLFFISYDGRMGWNGEQFFGEH